MVTDEPFRSNVFTYRPVEDAGDHRDQHDQHMELTPTKICYNSKGTQNQDRDNDNADHLLAAWILQR